MDRQVDINNMALFWQSMSSLAGIHRGPCIGLIQITKLYNAQSALFFADVTLSRRDLLCKSNFQTSVC